MSKKRANQPGYELKQDKNGKPYWSPMNNSTNKLSLHNIKPTIHDEKDEIIHSFLTDGYVKNNWLPETSTTDTVNGYTKEETWVTDYNSYAPEATVGPIYETRYVKETDNSDEAKIVEVITSVEYDPERVNEDEHVESWSVEGVWVTETTVISNAKWDGIGWDIQDSEVEDVSPVEYNGENMIEILKFASERAMNDDRRYFN